MAENNSPNGPLVLQNSPMSAQVLRQMLASLAPAPGVVGASHLLVTANGTPGMSVNVAAGFGIVAGTQLALTQGSYQAYNDATKSLAVGAADGTNPRNDLVVASVQDAAYSGVLNQWILQVIPGTPAVSPVDPAVPANSLKLARIRVRAATLSILTSDITDLRYRAVGMSGTGIYRARLWRSAAAVLSAGGATVIAYDNATYDPAGGAGTAYVIQADGFYRFSGLLTVSTTAAGQGLYASLMKNGAEVSRGDWQSSGIGGQGLSSQLGDELYFKVGDLLSVQAVCSSALSIVAGEQFCFFTLAKTGN